MRKRWVGVAGGAAVVPLGVIAGIGIWQNKGTDWWGAWGQWVGGVGSIAAAGVALIIAWLGWARADKERRDAEGDQAGLVTVRWGGTSKPPPPNQRVLLRAAGVYVDNHSTRPIYDVALESIQTPASQIPGQWDCRTGFGVVQREVVAPHDECYLASEYKRSEEQRPENDQREYGRRIITISFTDAEDRRWKRTSGQPPERLRTSPRYPDLRDA